MIIYFVFVFINNKNGKIYKKLSLKIIFKTFHLLTWRLCLFFIPKMTMILFFTCEWRRKWRRDKWSLSFVWQNDNWQWSEKTSCVLPASGKHIRSFPLPYLRSFSLFEVRRWRRPRVLFCCWQSLTSLKMTQLTVVNLIGQFPFCLFVFLRLFQALSSP